MLDPAVPEPATVEETPQTGTPQTDVPQIDIVPPETSRSEIPQPETLQTGAPQTDVPQTDTVQPQSENAQPETLPPVGTAPPFPQPPPTLPPGSIFALPPTVAPGLVSFTSGGQPAGSRGNSFDFNTQQTPVNLGNPPFTFGGRSMSLGTTPPVVPRRRPQTAPGGRNFGGRPAGARPVFPTTINTAPNVPTTSNGQTAGVQPEATSPTNVGSNPFNLGGGQPGAESSNQPFSFGGYGPYFHPPSPPDPLDTTPATDGDHDGMDLDDGNQTENDGMDVSQSPPLPGSETLPPTLPHQAQTLTQPDSSNYMNTQGLEQAQPSDYDGMDAEPTDLLESFNNMNITDQPMANSEVFVPDLDGWDEDFFNRNRQEGLEFLQRSQNGQYISPPRPQDTQMGGDVDAQPPFAPGNGLGDMPDPSDQTTQLPQPYGLGTDQQGMNTTDPSDPLQTAFADFECIVCGQRISGLHALDCDFYEPPAGIPPGVESNNLPEQPAQQGLEDTQNGQYTTPPRPQDTQMGDDVDAQNDRLCECCFQPLSRPHAGWCADLGSPAGTPPDAETSNMPEHPRPQEIDRLPEQPAQQGIDSLPEQPAQEEIDHSPCNQCNGWMSSHMELCPLGPQPSQTAPVVEETAPTLCPKCNQPDPTIPDNHEAWCDWYLAPSEEDKDIEWDSEPEHNKSDVDSDDDDCDECNGINGGHIGYCSRDRAGSGGSSAGSPPRSENGSEAITDIPPFVPNYLINTVDNPAYTPIQRNLGAYNPLAPPRPGQPSAFNPPQPSQNAPYNPVVPSRPGQPSPFDPVQPPRPSPFNPPQPGQSVSYNPLALPQPDQPSPFNPFRSTQGVPYDPLRPRQTAPLNPMQPVYRPTVPAQHPLPNPGLTAGIGSAGQSTFPPVNRGNQAGYNPPRPSAPPSTETINNALGISLPPSTGPTYDEFSSSSSSDNNMADDSPPAPRPLPPPVSGIIGPLSAGFTDRDGVICGTCNMPESSHRHNHCDDVCKTCRQYYHLHVDGYDCPGDGTDVDPEGDQEQPSVPQVQPAAPEAQPAAPESQPSGFLHGPVADEDCPFFECGAQAGDTHTVDCFIGQEKLDNIQQQADIQRAMEKLQMDEEIEAARVQREADDARMAAEGAVRRASKAELRVHVMEGREPIRGQREQLRDQREREQEEEDARVAAAARQARRDAEKRDDDGDRKRGRE